MVLAGLGWDVERGVDHVVIRRGVVDVLDRLQLVGLEQGRCGVDVINTGVESASLYWSRLAHNSPTVLHTKAFDLDAF